MAVKNVKNTKNVKNVKRKYTSEEVLEYLKSRLFVCSEDARNEALLQVIATFNDEKLGIDAKNTNNTNNTIDNVEGNDIVEE